MISGVPSASPPSSPALQTPGPPSAPKSHSLVSDSAVEVSLSHGYHCSERLSSVSACLSLWTGDKGLTDHAASGRIHTLAPHGDNTQTQPRQAERRRIGWSGGLIETRPSARSLGERTPSKSRPAVTMNGVCQLRPRDAPLCPPAPRPPCRGKGFAPASTLPVHPGEASAGHAALGAHSVLSSTVQRHAASPASPIPPKANVGSRTALHPS